MSDETREIRPRPTSRSTEVCNADEKCNSPQTRREFDLPDEVRKMKRERVIETNHPRQDSLTDTPPELEQSCRNYNRNQLELTFRTRGQPSKDIESRNWQRFLCNLLGL
jgi:hypothetical protein